MELENIPCDDTIISILPLPGSWAERATGWNSPGEQMHPIGLAKPQVIESDVETIEERDLEESKARTTQRTFEKTEKGSKGVTE